LPPFVLVSVDRQGRRASRRGNGCNEGILV
jgi:hypothetical protein